MTNGRRCARRFRTKCFRSSARSRRFPSIWE